MSLKNAEGQSLGVTLQHSNIVTKVDAGLALQQKALQEGDVVLGMNGDPLVLQLLQPAVERARKALGLGLGLGLGLRLGLGLDPSPNPNPNPNPNQAGAASLVFTVLRPKGKVNLAGATVTLGGSRKAGGHLLTVNTAAGAANPSSSTTCRGGQAVSTTEPVVWWERARASTGRHKAARRARSGGADAARIHLKLVLHVQCWCMPPPAASGTYAQRC